MWLTVNIPTVYTSFNCFLGDLVIFPSRCMDWAHHLQIIFQMEDKKSSFPLSVFTARVAMSCGILGKLTEEGWHTFSVIVHKFILPQKLLRKLSFTEELHTRICNLWAKDYFQHKMNILNSLFVCEHTFLWLKIVIKLAFNQNYGTSWE